MKKSELINTVKEICDAKGTKIQGFIFLRKKDTEIFWIEKKGLETFTKKKIKLEPFEFSYQLTLSLVVPFNSRDGKLDFDTSQIL